MAMMGAVISLAPNVPGSSFFFTGSSEVRQVIENPENNIDLKKALEDLSILLQ